MPAFACLFCNSSIHVRRLPQRCGIPIEHVGNCLLNRKINGLHSALLCPKFQTYCENLSQMRLEWIAMAKCGFSYGLWRRAGFPGAGPSLSLTPSAVSKLVARMENRLGVLLFRRSRRTMALTPEGEAFY